MDNPALAVLLGAWGWGACVYLTPNPAPMNRLCLGLLAFKSSSQTYVLGVYLSGQVKTVSTKGKATSAGR